MAMGGDRDAGPVELPRRMFCVVWVLLAATHWICGAFYYFSAYMYTYIQSTPAAWNIVTYHLSIDFLSYPAVAVVHGVLCALHGLYLLQMIVMSIKHRRLVFGALVHYQLSPQESRTRSFSRSAFSTVRRVCCSATGFFGIANPAFDGLFALREILQTILQSYQAYRMSDVLAQTSLTWTFAVLVVLNCWVTPLVYHQMSRYSLERVRLLCVGINLLMDLLTTVVLPVVLFLPYYSDFDPEVGDFAVTLYYDNYWMINQINNFSILLVQSWADLIQRVIFATNLFLTMSKCKAVLQYLDGKMPVTAPSHCKSIAVLPVSKGAVEPHDVASHQRVHRRWLRITHQLFVAWGAVVLIFQIRAATNKSSDPCCVVPAFPWLSTKPACSLAIIDCVMIGTNGNQTDVANVVGTIDASRVFFLMIQHCPMLEMPPVIQTFAHLRILRIDNSTIAQWTDTAAVTNENHPRLVLVLLSRVAMDGIPTGLLNPDFPADLLNIELCLTNLSSVPDALDLRWPQGMWLSLDHSRFASVPDAVVRLNTAFLTMTGNQITTISETVLANRILLDLSSNPLVALPNVTSAGTLPARLSVANSRITSVPIWLNAAYVAANDVYLGGTPMCSNSNKDWPVELDRKVLCRVGFEFDCTQYYQFDRNST